MKKLYANADFKGKFDYFKENSDGSICCRIPKKWLKINPGSANKREMTEEQRQAAAENLEIARMKKDSKRRADVKNSGKYCINQWRFRPRMVSMNTLWGKVLKSKFEEKTMKNKEV